MKINTLPKLLAILTVMYSQPIFSSGSYLEYGGCVVDLAGFEELGEGYFRDERPINITKKKIEVVRREKFKSSILAYPNKSVEITGDLKLTFLSGKYFVFILLDFRSDDSIVVFSDFKPDEFLTIVDCLKIYGVDTHFLKQHMTFEENQ